MARSPKGTLFSVATAFAASKTTTGVSNATEAVVTCNAHGYSVGDVVEMQSGWGGLQKRAFRIKAVTTNDFTLEGANTTDANRYPAGSGAGSVRKVNTWVQLTTVMRPTSSGGDAKKITYSFVETDVDFNLNNGFTAVDNAIDLDADSIGTPGYEALKSLTQVQTDTILRRLAKSGAVSYLPCKVALNEEEIMQDDQIVTVKCAFSGNNVSTRYGA